MARRVAAGILALVATFGLLTAGAAVAHEATVTSPVARAMRMRGVSAYRLDTASQAPALTVDMTNGVDLEAMCQALSGRLVPVFGQAPAITPIGPGQSRLRGLVEAAAVPVAQGIATGQFVAMADAVRSLAAKDGVRARVEVDTSAVYVTLVPRHGSEAYAVFTRPPQAAGAAGAPA